MCVRACACACAWACASVTPHLGALRWFVQRLGTTSLDLRALFITVVSRGGYAAVTGANAWADVYTDLVHGRTPSAAAEEAGQQVCVSCVVVCLCLCVRVCESVYRCVCRCPATTNHAHSSTEAPPCTHKDTWGVPALLPPPLPLPPPLDRDGRGGPPR